MRFKEAYEGWHAGELTQIGAARLLGMCDWSFRRYLARYEESAYPLREARKNQQARLANSGYSGLRRVLRDCGEVAQRY